MQITQLESIPSADLSIVTGGDGWSDYKKTVSDNWNSTVDRGKATYNDARAGNWGSAADNAGGTAYNAMQTFNSAVSPWIPAIGAPGGGKK
jgi:hypothetical protein